MRSLRQTSLDLAWPSPRHARGRLLGLPFAVAAIAPVVPFGWRASVVALMAACVASFLVFVPMTALVLNGGKALAENAPAPPLTVRAYGTLLVLWTLTAWLAARYVPV